MLRRFAGIEFVVASGADGGRGNLWFDRLALKPIVRVPATVPPAVKASSQRSGNPAARVICDDDESRRQYRPEGSAGIFGFDADAAHLPARCAKPRPVFPVFSLVRSILRRSLPGGYQRTSPPRQGSAGAVPLELHATHMLNPLEITGRAATHVVDLPELGCTVHRSAVQAVVELGEACHAAGIQLAIASSFRSFDRQVQIWNAKYIGERPVLGRDGRPLDRTRADPNALIDAILAWSALPGASRHHWGTDLDVVDGSVLASGYQPRLVPEEYAPGGVFARLGAWMDANLAKHGFFRPYRTERGGVQPEAWHVSYAPIATQALEALTLEVLLDAVAASSMHGRETVLARIPELYERYVKGIDPPDEVLEV